MTSPSPLRICKRAASRTYCKDSLCRQLKIKGRLEKLKVLRGKLRTEMSLKWMENLHTTKTWTEFRPKMPVPGRMMSQCRKARKEVLLRKRGMLELGQSWRSTIQS